MTGAKRTFQSFYFLQLSNACQPQKQVVSGVRVLSNIMPALTDD